MSFTLGCLGPVLVPLAVAVMTRQALSGGSAVHPEGTARRPMLLLGGPGLGVVSGGSSAIIWCHSVLEAMHGALLGRRAGLSWENRDAFRVPSLGPFCPSAPAVLGVRTGHGVSEDHSPYTLQSWGCSRGGCSQGGVGCTGPCWRLAGGVGLLGKRRSQLLCPRPAAEATGGPGTRPEPWAASSTPRPSPRFLHVRTQKRGFVQVQLA